MNLDINSFIKDDETLDDLQLNGIHLIQKKKAFRFGIDAVLLANFAEVKRRHRVIDICTGTGIVPFVIYGKKSPESILGIEIQEEFVEMAKRSVEINNAQEKVKFIKGILKI